MDTREKVFDFIVAYKIDRQGNTPSQRTIMRAVGLATTSAVKHHLEKLEDDGLITRSDDGREIEVIGATWTPPKEWIAPVAIPN